MAAAEKAGYGRYLWTAVMVVVVTDVIAAVAALARLAVLVVGEILIVMVDEDRGTDRCWTTREGGGWRGSTDG